MIEDLGPAEHERLYLAALVGDTWLAHELEALDLSDETDFARRRQGALQRDPKRGRESTAPELTPAETKPGPRLAGPM